MNVELKIVETEDGSHSLYSKELNESYHSKFGAINESKHVFINAGLNHLSNTLKEINLLEIGFGTGLNAFLTYLKCNKNKVKVNYYSIEPYPLSSEIYRQLNYSEILGKKGPRHLFISLHKFEWNRMVNLNEYFSLTKMKEKLEGTKLRLDFFHLVYFDAFSPDVHPELWTQGIFEKIYSSLKTDSIFVTYSAKGAVRRNLQEAGFEVERIPGPKGKREMLRAFKTIF
jgi:tRNA U34 5-methylaminomethyl-2-thiouridine-forming methyltransferase MnmC